MAAMLVAGGVGKEGKVWEGPTANNSEAKKNEETDNGEAPSCSNAGDPVTTGFPTGNGTPMKVTVGVATTCQACSTPRVSRRVTCQDCDATYHWSCIGFYEHKYQRPGVDWRCKACKGAEPPPAVEGAAAPAVQAERAPESGDVIDVGVEGTPSTTAPGSVSLAAAVQAVTVDTSAAAAATAAEAKAKAIGTSVTTVKTSPAVADTPTVTTTPTGERICPVCGKDIGRKRTMDCSVCRTPSHAGCVNVRGAETPKSWVCRDCHSGAQGNGEATARKEVVAAVSTTLVGGAEMVRVGDVPKVN